MKRICVSLGLLAASLTQAWAEDAPVFQPTQRSAPRYTAKILLEVCQNTNDRMQVFCTGFLSGTYRAGVSLEKICTGERASGKALKDQFVSTVAKNDNIWDDDAAKIAIEVFQVRFGMPPNCAELKFN